MGNSTHPIKPDRDLSQRMYRRLALRPNGCPVSELADYLSVAEEDIIITAEDLTDRGLVQVSRGVVVPVALWDMDRVDLVLNVPRLQKKQFQEYCAEIDQLVQELRGQHLPVLRPYTNETLIEILLTAGAMNAVVAVAAGVAFFVARITKSRGIPHIELTATKRTRDGAELVISIKASTAEEVTDAFRSFIAELAHDINHTTYSATDISKKDKPSYCNSSSDIDFMMKKREYPSSIAMNVLVVFANPKGSNPLRLENEDRVIRQCIERSRYRDNIKIEIRHAARVDDFARALLDGEYRIVQFSGHGTGKGLAFENELREVDIIPKDALAETLSDYSPPIECVILNACYSNIHGQNLSMRVPYTIVMDGPISDEGATEFTRGFYDAIGASKDIEFAYKEGCRRIKLKGLPDGMTPLLYVKDIQQI